MPKLLSTYILYYLGKFSIQFMKRTCHSCSFLTIFSMSVLSSLDSVPHVLGLQSARCGDGCGGCGDE